MPNLKSSVDVDLAHALRADGLTLREIGERFGVSHQRIAQLLGPTGRRLKERPPISRKRIVSTSALPILCKTSGCVKRINSHGYCATCYHKWLYYNSSKRRRAVLDATLRYTRRMQTEQSERGARFRQRQRETQARYRAKRARSRQESRPSDR